MVALEEAIEIHKGLQEYLAKIITANEAYHAELDKPKRDRATRAILRHQVDQAFHNMIEFCKEHGL